jgi:ferredoxin-NADP reductase
MSLTARVLRSPVLAALTTPHGVDHYLEQVNPMWTVHQVRARVVAIDRETPDAATLTLRPNAAWLGFRAGQYVQVGVEIGGARRTRCFSLSGSAHRADGLITITVRAHDDGLVSKHLVHDARPGDVVQLSQADGEFTLPTERPRRIVLISGGSGITPVMSMLRTLADEGYDGEVTFLHYSRTPEHTIFGSELAARGIEVVHTRAGGERFDAAHLPGGYADLDSYVCGPAGLVTAVRDAYDGSDRLRVEYFKTTALAGTTAGGTVSYTRSEASADNSGQTLLEQAEAAGLRPEYGCRMGICFSCTARKTEGRVRNVLTGAESAQPDEDIRICVSAPVGDCAIDL